MPVRPALTLDAKPPQDFPARCDQESWKWELLRRVGRLPRAGRHWRGRYKRRSIIERMFSSLKRSLLLGGTFLPRLRQSTVARPLSLLNYFASILACLLAGDLLHFPDMSVDWTPSPAGAPRCVA